MRLLLDTHIFVVSRRIAQTAKACFKSNRNC